MGGGGVRGRDQGGCERRIEVFVKIHFFLGGGRWGGRGQVGGGGGQSGCERRIEVFVMKIQKKKIGGGGGSGGGGGVGGGVRLDVNEELNFL